MYAYWHYVATSFLMLLLMLRLCTMSMPLCAINNKYECVLCVYESYSFRFECEREQQRWRTEYNIDVGVQSGCTHRRYWYCLVHTAQWAIVIRWMLCAVDEEDFLFCSCEVIAHIYIDGGVHKAYINIFGFSYCWRAACSSSWLIMYMYIWYVNAFEVQVIFRQ